MLFIPRIGGGLLLYSNLLYSNFPPPLRGKARPSKRNTQIDRARRSTRCDNLASDASRLRPRARRRPRRPRRAVARAWSSTTLEPRTTTRRTTRRSSSWLACATCARARSLEASLARSSHRVERRALSIWVFRFDGRAFRLGVVHLSPPFEFERRAMHR